MPSIHANDRISRKSDMLSAEIEGDVVIMNPDHGAYLHLDSVGSDIWRRLAEPTTSADLISGLTESYDGEADVIAADTLALLDRLNEKGLLVVSPSAA